jgi:hypothetical protein
MKKQPRRTAAPAEEKSTLYSSPVYDIIDRVYESAAREEET